MLFFLQRLRDARCHLLLLWTKLKVLCLGERTILGEECANAFDKFAAQTVFQRDHEEEMTKHEGRSTKEIRSSNDERTGLSFRAQSRNPVAILIGNAAGSFDPESFRAQDDKSFHS